jgi:cysteine desulfurase / selenocysteine lyase
MEFLLIIVGGYKMPTTIAQTLEVIGMYQEVPVLGGSVRPYINFDNAASTPALSEVAKTVNDFMAWYSSVHRGTGFKSRLATQAYEDAREIVAEFFGANSMEHTVIFGKNATEAINKLAHRFPFKPDDVVLVSMLEHHSNDLPWRKQAKVVHIKTDEQGRLDENDFEEKLRKYAGKVRLVAVTGASNVTGHLTDIHRLAEKTHAVGAQIMVDCAQLAPHRAIDMKHLADPQHLDYIAISAHKMYAPFGTGALIGRKDTFEQGEPEYRGGGTVSVVTTEAVFWADAPDRDEAGSPNVIGAVALAAAIKALTKMDMREVARHEIELTDYALGRLASVEGLKLYGDISPGAADRRVGVIPFNLKDMSHFQVAAILAAEWGIGVRNGCFCAHPYVTQLLGYSPAEMLQAQNEILAGKNAAKPGMVRASFGLYNTFEEVDVLVEALDHISRQNYYGHYYQDEESGEYFPLGWNPPTFQYFSLH